MELELELEPLPSAEELNRVGDTFAVAETRGSYDGNAFEPRGFKKLRVWQAGMDVAVACYRVSTQFPQSEAFGLTRQLRNAASSITLNIAEGWGRNSRAEFARFSDIARGSAAEADSAIELAVRLGYLQADQASDVIGALNGVSAMLNSLATNLRKGR